VIRKESKDETR
jgi:hypothetical protein